MSPQRRLAFWAVVAVQAVVPLAMIGWNEAALASGTPVRVKTVPLDPVDLFRGRYVRLNYTISSLRAGEPFRAGQTVYVELTDRGDFWSGDVATTTRPEQGTFIRGRALADSSTWPVRIEYGIETYYTDEDEAPRLEREARSLYVDVRLDDDGGARIEGVAPAPG